MFSNGLELHCHSLCHSHGQRDHHQWTCLTNVSWYEWDAAAVRKEQMSEARSAALTAATFLSD